MSLTVSDLSLSVRDGSTDRHLLRDISFEVDPGEILGITGPSGSGKSTLLGVLGCLQQADSGTAVLHTHDRDIHLTGEVSGTDAARIRRHHIGIVFQQPNLIPALSVRDQLILVTRLGRVWPPSRAGRHAARAKADELLHAVGLLNLAQRPVGTLSGGQQARVNLARALMHGPSLLLIDEPTAALDQHSAAEVTTLIADMARTYRAATLLVSHDPEQMAAVDRRITLVDGRIRESSRI
ncbi:putative ABC transporter ATP-binding protein [Corynebacterium faecale]|uniref:ABC transporter ATP-binding protein n=1 Tax=Corynebacterium faecale TaxID=1758466 RepID=UPI0025B3957F|nr:ABC transporter ATP-binding protein [Corynebacterium faecale]WJY92551.1 putative ABC transporter ATP-binding protein [Corynebacterium faecale]